MTILKMVGLNGPNIHGDVKVVQSLLNKAITTYPKFKQVQVKIEVDGDCGDLTVASIEKFQRKVMKFNSPDKRVEPGRDTWKKLNNNIHMKAQIKNLSIAQKPSVDKFVSWLDGGLSSGFIGVVDAFIDDMNSLLKTFSQSSLDPTGKNAVSGEITSLRQGDKQWGKTKLGNSKKGTIHGYGCALVSLTMAATYMGSKTKHWPVNMTPQKLTPIVTNDIFKKAGLFASSSLALHLVGGAKALGMEGKDSGIGAKMKSSAIAKINNGLKNGLILAHVDYKKDWKGDHWILLTDKNSDGSYSGIDPAYGKTLKLFTSPDDAGEKHEYILLYGRSASMEPKTPDNVKTYKVVRFITLK